MQSEKGEETPSKKRKILSLILLIFISTSIISSYIDAWDTFTPQTHVSAAEYGPPSPAQTARTVLSYGTIGIVILVIAMALYLRARARTF